MSEEDTLTIREEKVDGLVKLGTLNIGDEFETDTAGGKVVWVVNSNHAKAVDVIFDGHTRAIGIAPSLMVRVRKAHTLAEAKKLSPAEFFQELDNAITGHNNEAEDEEIPDDGSQCYQCDAIVDSTDLSRCDECEAYFCEDCCSEHGEGDNFHVLCDACELDENERVTSPIREPREVKLLKLADIRKEPVSVLRLPEAEWTPVVGEYLVAAKTERVSCETQNAANVYKEEPEPTVADIPRTQIRVVRLTPVGATPVPAGPTLPTCKFDLTLNEQQIKLLRFDNIKQMFCSGLYHGWTKETFFAVAKELFPSLKAGQEFESCVSQINLYKSLLRKAGKLA